ncbi:MAG: 6-carboxytetrahydropterin synthase [Phycisphaeraceae bacterium]|nr:6-carboxytetrahydropterin synthase [Phycisphaeraceae bacterium]MBX3407022.1 6-carboxytetrahydropterin synthase [Phycisphaeraceae bacterium]
MYEITVNDEFCAAHAIIIRGERERLHGHNWRVSVTIGGAGLDGDGLLLDFHALERIVREVIAPFRDQNLNETPPFDRMNPTAEQVARHIADSVDRGIRPLVPAGVRVAAVRVTEAPGCSVVYRP